MTDDLPGYDGKDEALRRLIEKSSLLEELQQHPGWAVYTQIAQDSIDAYQTRMNSGRLTLEDYRFIAGFLDGARQTINISGLLKQQLERIQQQQVAEEGEDAYDPIEQMVTGL